MRGRITAFRISAVGLPEIREERPTLGGKREVSRRPLPRSRRDTALRRNTPPLVPSYSDRENHGLNPFRSLDTFIRFKSAFSGNLIV